MDQADQQTNVPHVEAVVLGPPGSGKAHLLGRLLIDCGAFDRRVIERFMAPTSDLYSRMVPAQRRLEGLIRTRSELARGITLTTRRFKLRTKRYPLSLANVPSLGFFERGCITGAANADLALVVVSAAAAEFEACMADRKAKSLFEVALVAKGCGIEQLVVVLTKADEVLKELKPGQGMREYQALIEDRERRVVALLLSMQFKKENLQVVIVSVWEEQGVLTPLFANGLSLLDALENIRWSELPMARTRRQQGPSAPFRLVVLGADRIGGIGTVVSGRLVSGRWDTPNHSGRELAFYPQTMSKQQTEGWRQHTRGAPVETGSVESFHEGVSTPLRAGACISVHARRVPRFLFYAGMVARDAGEDAKTSLELTVTEFAVSVRAINPVQSKSPWKVLSTGQEMVVHSHSARVTCKVMAILSVKRGKKQTKRVLREVRMGEVAEVRLRPLTALVVEPFDVCPRLGRVLLRDTVTLAFGRVLRVVCRYKESFVQAVNNPEQLWELLRLEPACLLGRDEHNNTLLHLLIDQRQEGVEQVVQQVEKHFGRLTVQKLMRVRNSRGHTAIHLALTAGLFGVAAVLLSYGAPLMPSKEEERRLSKLWKKPIPSPIDGLRQRYTGSPVNLALLCLMVLTRDRDDFANLDEMLPPKAMQEHYTIALNSLLLQLTPA